MDPKRVKRAKNRNHQRRCRRCRARTTVGGYARVFGGS